MEDLHFANMVQYEASMRQEDIEKKSNTLNKKLSEMCYAEDKRQSSLQNNRMAQTIEHEVNVGRE